MTLSREKLRSGYFQQLAKDNPLQLAPLTEDQLAASLDQTLQRSPAADQAWVFAYGSLIWNPLINFDRQAQVTLHGYRRRFCLKTVISRGDEKNPGLLLGLLPGGSCRGLALRLSGPKLREELSLLWRREMVTSAYAPRWVSLRVHDDASGNNHSIQAIAFVMNRQYQHFEADLTQEQTAQILSRARGPLGTSAEYLFKTQQSLVAHGICDQHLTMLSKRVRGLIAANGEP